MKTLSALFLFATIATAQSVPPQPTKVAAAMMAANLIEHPDPICSPEHKGDKLAGTIVLDAIIAPDGRIANLNVISGPEALRGCVVDAVGQWTYKPYLLNGQPIAVETTITISFDLGKTVVPPAIGGVMGGFPAVSAPPRLPDPTYGPKGPVRISGGVIAGTILSKGQPANFPPIACDQHVAGAVVLHAIIGINGHIQELQATSGPEVLREPAIEAVTQWTYKPYLLNGVPTEVDTTITLNIDIACT